MRAVTSTAARKRGVTKCRLCGAEFYRSENEVGYTDDGHYWRYDLRHPIQMPQGWTGYKLTIWCPKRK